jgi:hypothetical protein
MSKPTILSPWFVVVRIEDDGTVSGDYLPPKWYTESEGDEEQFTTDETKARLFDSIHSAARVARATAGYAVVVADEEALKEFRPKGL